MKKSEKLMKIIINSNQPRFLFWFHTGDFFLFYFPARAIEFVNQGKALIALVYLWPWD